MGEGTRVGQPVTYGHRLPDALDYGISAVHSDHKRLRETCGRKRV